MKTGKRICAFLLSFALLLPYLPAVSAADNPSAGPADGGVEQTASAEVYPSLQNPSFELGGDAPADWSLKADADETGGSFTLETDTEGYVYRGAKSLKLTYSGTGTYGVVSAPVSVTAGRLYRLELHSRTETGGFQAILDFYGADGAVIPGASRHYTATGRDDWKFITTNTSSGILPAEAPEDAAYATVSLTVTSGSTVYFDALDLTELAPDRALENGGFEDGMDPQRDEPFGFSSWEWSYGYYGTREIADEPVHGGSSSLKVSTVNRAHSNNTVRTEPVSVTAGKEYRFSAAVWKESGDQPYLSVEYYDANGSSVTAGQPARVTSAGTGKWEVLTIDSTVPDGVAFATVTVWQSGANRDGVYYADDFSVTPVTAPTVPVETDLQNPSFEEGTPGALPDGWTKIGETGSAVVAENGDGTRSARLDWASGTNGIASNRFSVEPDTFYTASCVFQNSTGLKPRVYLKFYDEEGQPLTADFWLGYEFMELAPNDSGSTGFLRTSGYIRSPGEAASAELTVEQTAQTGGSLLLDAVSVEQTPPSDSLLNGGFEDTALNAIGYPVGWSAYFWTNAAEIRPESEVVSDGGRAVRMDMTGYTGSSLRGGLISPLVSVEPGETYEFSARVYNTGSDKLSLYCYWINQDGIQVLTKYPVSGKTNEWETVTTGGINAPSGAVAAAVMLYQSGGVSYADDVSIRKVSQIDYDDSLPNPGFEEGLNDDGSIKSWNKYGTGNRAELVSDLRHGGRYAVKLSADEGGGNGLESYPVAVTPGQSYRGSIMIYNEISTSDLYLGFYDENNRRIGVKIVTLSRTKEWTVANVDAVAPAGSVYATLLIYQNSGVRGVCYADDGAIAPYTPPEEPVQNFSAIVSGHPKVLFTQADIPSLLEKAQDTEKTVMGSSGKEIADQIVAQADAYAAEAGYSHTFDDVYGHQSLTISFPLPPVGVDVSTLSPDQPSGYGNYPFWTAIARSLEDRMEIFSMAYTLTGNTAYADKATELAMAMTTWESWHDPKDRDVTTNLDTAHLVFGVSAVYDMLYARLTDGQRETLRNALIEKGLEPLYADAKEKLDYNIQALRTSALTIGALALMGDVDAELTDKYLTRSTGFFTWYLNERKTSGNQEGFQYTSYTMENLIDAFECLARVTGHSEFISDAWLNEDLTRWVASFSAPGSYTLAPVSDISETNGFYQTFSVLAGNGNGLAGWYLSKARPLSSVLLTKQFLYLNKAMPVADPQTDVGNAAVIDSVGWGAMRTGWGPTDTLFGLISNNTGLGHNHFDQNSFLIATNGQWLASDPGYSNFAYDQEWNFKSKVGHNTILVDWEKDTAAGGQVYKGGGSLAPKLLTSPFACMIGSAAPAYGDLLSKFDRNAVMVNHPGQPYYLLFDDLASSQPRTFTWSLFTDGWDGLRIDGANVSGVASSQTGRTIEVEKGESKLYAQFVSNDPLQIDTDLYADAYGPYIHASNTVKSADRQFLTVLNTYNSAISIPAPVFQPTQVCSDGTTGALSQGSALFRGSGAGSRISWEFDVDEAGEYDLSLIMPNSYWYGVYQAAVDETDLGAPYDGYTAYPNMTAGNENRLGKVRLSAGRHTLTMTCTGTSAPESSEHRYYTAVTSIRLQSTADSNGAEKPVTISESYDTESTLGAVIEYAQDRDDIVLFRRSGGTVSGGGLSADAAQASLLGRSGDGRCEGFALTDGTSLQYLDRTLLTASQPISAYVDCSDGSGVSVTVNAESDTTVSLPIGPLKTVGNVSGGACSYDQSTGVLTFTAPAGESTLQFTVTPGLR